MKKLVSILYAILVLLGGRSEGATAELKSAKVTQIQNDVRLQEAALERGAAVGDLVSGKKTLVTGRKSRAELLFNDNSIARLGANSVFSFKPGSRDIELKSGFLLLHTPKGKGGAKITTPSASASVLGTTIMLSALPNGGMKLVVLEGTATVTYNGVTQTVEAGQLVFLTQEQGMSPPISIDLGKLVGSSGLVNNFAGPIGSENQINEAVQNQATLIEGGQLAQSGFTIGGDQKGLTVVDSPSLEAALEELLQELTNLKLENPPATADLTGALTINPNAVIDYANAGFDGLPTLTDANGNLLIGSFDPPDLFEGIGILGDGNGVDVFFSPDRLFVTGGPPMELHDEDVLSLNFFATGDSVSEGRPNAILFDGFQDLPGLGEGEGDGFDSLNFIALRGGVKVVNTSLFHDGFTSFIAAGFEGDGGDVEISNSFLGGTEETVVGRGWFIGSLGGDVRVEGGSRIQSLLENQLEDYEAAYQGGFGEIFGDTITLASLGGNVTVLNSKIEAVEQAFEYEGEYFEYYDFEGSDPAIILATGEGHTTVDHSQLHVRSDSMARGVLIGGGGPDSMVLIDHSVINTALGAMAGPIDIAANRIDLNYAQLVAVTETGSSSAPVSLIANLINLTESTIRGSTITLGNPADPGSAQINFTGVNQFFTDNGVAEDVAFHGNIGGPGTYEILQNPAPPVVPE